MVLSSCLGIGVVAVFTLEGDVLGAEVDHEAGGGVRGYDIVHALDIANEKLINLKEAKVDALTDICPFCQLQFDRGQIEIQEKFGVSYNLPVLHFAELLGLAQGMSPQDLGLDLHGISCEPFLQKVL